VDALLPLSVLEMVEQLLESALSCACARASACVGEDGCQQHGV
jgi:hypothetical protein